MAKQKYYLRDGDYSAWDLSHFKDNFEDGTYCNPIELQEMVRFFGSEMYCRENGDIVESGPYGDCGSDCDGYNPCNGKSGRCRELKNAFEETGKVFIYDGVTLEEEK